MKYLNTSYLELLGSYGDSITSANGYVKTSTARDSSKNSFSIPVNISGNVYLSFNCPYLGGYGNALLNFGIGFLNTNNWVGFVFSSTSSRIVKCTYSYGVIQLSQLWLGTTSLDDDGNRIIHVRMDTTAKTLDMYCNGELIVDSLSYNITGNVGELRFGKLNGNFDEVISYNNFIVSDSSYPPAEKVLDVTPTITTTDWTVTSGVATTDTVGDEMTLTVPFGAIDESSIKPTGYTVGLLNSAQSANVNAVDITQGATTDQVVLPSGSTQSDYFTVSQVSAILATVVARSVTV